MKLLFDENLSVKLPARLADLFPDSTHVDMCGLHGASDRFIWEYAKDHELTIVSRDTDFYNRSMTAGHPPKVIALRIGNCSTAAVDIYLRRRASAIEHFLQSPKASALIVR